MPSQGWAHPLRERKAHYFVDGTSLCEKAHYGGPLQVGHALPGDCRTCAGIVRGDARFQGELGAWVSTPKARTYTCRSEVRH